MPNDDLKFPLQQLVTACTATILDKAYKAEEKYDWRNLWALPGWEVDLRTKIREHMEKGDPRDVALYAMFAMWHGWSLKDGGQVSPRPQDTAPVDETVSLTGDIQRKREIDALNRGMHMAVATLWSLGNVSEAHELAAELDCTHEQAVALGCDEFDVEQFAAMERVGQ
jgi:hypothetical protein